jgi:hypothetical protein
MQRRMVDTARRGDAPQWEDLAGRALAILPLYRPVPRALVYHVRVDDIVVQAAEQDLTGALLDLITAVLALGEELLPPGTSPVDHQANDHSCPRAEDPCYGAAAAVPASAACFAAAAGGPAPWPVSGRRAGRAVQRVVHLRTSRQYQRTSAQALPPSATIEVAAVRIPHSQQQWTTAGPARAAPS